MRYKQIDELMKGELQKGVWSLFKEYKTMKASEVADKMGRQQSNVTAVIKRLIALDAVEQCTLEGKLVRGLYKIAKGFRR